MSAKIKVGDTVFSTKEDQYGTAKIMLVVETTDTAAIVLRCPNLTSQDRKAKRVEYPIAELVKCDD